MLHFECRWRSIHRAVTHLVEQEVAEDNEVERHLAAQDWEDVLRHSLPEVEEKLLYLREPENVEMTDSGSSSPCTSAQETNSSIL